MNFVPGTKEVGHGTTAHVLPSLQVDGMDMEYVGSWTHLGHILYRDCRDNMDIENRCVQTVK